jgi:tRNA (guanine37-N1)-methyltransferase
MTVQISFQVITLFPEMIQVLTENGVVGQAFQKNLLSVETINPRQFTADLHKTVDDRPFGGGDGMILLMQPLQKAIEAAQENLKIPGSAKAKVIYLSPQGAPLTQKKVVSLAREKNLILLCGRYGGVDQRLINQFVDEEISIGDYILSGGELAAGVLIDAVSRQIPGVLGHEGSATSDSFSGDLQNLLEAPSWTRPRDLQGQLVPEILLSGNHALIQKWKHQVSLLVTLLKRPDLMVGRSLSKRESQELQKFWDGLSNSDKEVLGLSALSSHDVEQLIRDDETQLS